MVRGRKLKKMETWAPSLEPFDGVFSYTLGKNKTTRCSRTTPYLITLVIGVRQACLYFPLTCTYSTLGGTSHWRPHSIKRFAAQTHCPRRGTGKRSLSEFKLSINSDLEGPPNVRAGLLVTGFPNIYHGSAFSSSALQLLLNRKKKWYCDFQFGAGYWKPIVTRCISDPARIYS